jgi:hypothetical protein
VRHGLKVRLQPAATGGLTALVWLPDPVVVLPEAGAPAGFAPAEPEAQARHAGSAAGPRAAWRLRALAPSQPAQEPSEAGVTSGAEASPAEDAADGRRLPIYEAVESDWFSRRRQRSAVAMAAGHDGQDPAP